MSVGGVEKKDAKLILVLQAETQNRQRSAHDQTVNTIARIW